MTLDSKKTYLYYQGSSFNVKAASLYSVFSCYEQSGVALAIIESSTNTCVAFEYLPLAAEPNQLMTKALDQSKLAKLFFSRKNLMGFGFEYWTLAPQYFVQQDKIQEILQFNYAIQEELKLLGTSELPEMQASIVYGSSLFSEEELKNEWPTTIYTHIYSGLIERAWLQRSGKPKLRLYVNPERLFVILTSEKGILAVNSFECQTEADMAYFAMYLLEQSELDNTQVQCEVLGGESIVHNLKKILAPYLELVEDEIWNLKFDEGIPKDLSKEFTEVLSLHLCE